MEGNGMLVREVGETEKEKIEKSAKRKNGIARENIEEQLFTTRPGLISF